MPFISVCIVCLRGPPQFRKHPFYTSLIYNVDLNCECNSHSTKSRPNPPDSVTMLMRSADSHDCFENLRGSLTCPRNEDFTCLMLNFFLFMQKYIFERKQNKEERRRKCAQKVPSYQRWQTARGPLVQWKGAGKWTTGILHSSSFKCHL